MKYGHFDDDKKEYVITTPHTPYPWINYLGTEDFFSLISHMGGGYCFYRDAKLRRLLRYRYNHAPIDEGGRYFYIQEGEDYWTPTFMPVKKKLDSFECRHGLGYTKFSGRRGDIRVGVTSFVPLNVSAEVHMVTVENRRDTPFEGKLFSYVEFCLWNAHDDANNLQRNLSTGEVEIDGSTIYHKTEYRERRNHFAFFHVDSPIVGFDTDRDAFLGSYNGPSSPEAVTSGSSKNSVAHGWAPIGSHSLEVSLEPGAKKTIVFTLGYVENAENLKWESPGVINKSRARALYGSFSEESQVAGALDDLANHWSDLLSQYTIDSPDEKLNRMVNIWNPYQCMVTFNMSRSASYFETGVGRGMGFRDSNQDLLGFVHLVPKRARERILDIAATQLPDGGAYHQYQPLTKRGNDDIGSGFNDDPLWLIAGTCAYIRETGDYSILDESVPFDNNPKDTASLFEHMRRSMTKVSDNLGPHGLPLIGRADWNDCLNLNCFSLDPDEPYQTTENVEGGVAESVFIAGMFVLYGKEFAELCDAIDKPDLAGGARELVKQMADAVMEHGTDPDWFLRAFDYYGKKIGSSENDEGSIFIEPQGFCVMAGMGVDGGFAQRALDSVKDRLDTPYGIMLHKPAYSRYRPELGEISSYPPGYKENAGIFCHNNPWVMIAETVLGRGDRAFEYYRKVAPAYKEDIIDTHKMEPYVYSQMIAGNDAVHHGQAKNSWLTGTAAWNFVAISQHILGVRPEHEGLRVNPCIDAEIGEFTITRQCRGAKYVIRAKNVGTSTGAKLVVNGVPQEGTLVPYSEAGATVTIDCSC